VITVGGVFILGWGYLSTIFLNLLSLSGGIGAAIYPLYKYRHLANHNQPLSQGDKSAIASFNLQTEGKQAVFVQPNESSDVKPSPTDDLPPNC
jgi:hypothetical protein